MVKMENDKTRYIYLASKTESNYRVHVWKKLYENISVRFSDNNSLAKLAIL